MRYESYTEFIWILILEVRVIVFIQFSNNSCRNHSFNFFFLACCQLVFLWKLCIYLFVDGLFVNFLLQFTPLCSQIHVIGSEGKMVGLWAALPFRLDSQGVILPWVWREYTKVIVNANMRWLCATCFDWLDSCLTNLTYCLQSKHTILTNL